MDKNLIFDETMPLVSVLLPVYNGEEFIEQTISSILNQSYSNFELIIINDCSIDQTENIIQSFDDDRIRYCKHAKNLRLIATLNEGLDLSRGKYIARIDADDIAHFDRLKKQVEFLEQNQDYVLVGTSVGLIKNNLITDEVIKYYAENNDLRFAMCFYCPFIHPSIMMRNSVIQSNNLKFNNEFLHAEDYDFWTRLSKYGMIANLDCVLTYYRIHENQISARFKNYQIEMMEKIQERYRSLLFKKYTTSEIQVLFYDSNKGDRYYFKILLIFLSDLEIKSSFFYRYLIKKLRNYVFESEKIYMRDYFTIIYKRREIQINVIQLIKLFRKILF
jgi:glycosyltransferase involved in cell wall biosynthesis